MGTPFEGRLRNNQILILQKAIQKANQKHIDQMPSELSEIARNYTDIIEKNIEYWENPPL